MQLEQVALADDYFVERKLYPNVDFYTGLIYKAMGFPTKMFTVLFALGRLPGWIAQWREMIEDPETKIGRPRQVYIGADRAQVRRARRPLSAERPRRPAPPTRAAHPRRGRAALGAAAPSPGAAPVAACSRCRVGRRPVSTTDGGRHGRAGPLPATSRSRPGCGSTCGRRR